MLETNANEPEVHDIIGRPIKVGDFVYHYNSLYEVTKVSLARSQYAPQRGMLSLMIWPQSKTSTTKRAFSFDCCVIPRADAVTWMLKQQ